MLLHTSSPSSTEQHQVFLRTFGKVDAIALGTASAVAVSLVFMLVTFITTFQNVDSLKQQIDLINHYLPGFQTTFPEALLSIPYGIIIGFLVGFFFAIARNIAVRTVLNLIELSNFTAAIEETHNNLE